MGRNSNCTFDCILFIVLTLQVISGSIIDNTTRRFATKPDQTNPERSATNTTAGILSTRSDFISASTVIGPPKSVTQQSIWTLRNWNQNSFADLRKILDGRKPVDNNEYENIHTESVKFSDKESSKTDENEKSNFYIYTDQNEESEVQTQDPYSNETTTQSTGHQNVTQQNRIDNLTNTKESTQGNSSPHAEALHSTSEEENVTIDQKQGEATINKVTQEPLKTLSILENLTDIQFSWVDIIIAVCCTAAVLLILINIGVCIQYCVQKKSKIKRFRPYTMPLSSALRLRMGSLRVRKPSLRKRPWISGHRSLLGRPNTGPFQFMWPGAEGASQTTHDTNSIDITTHSTNSTDVSMLSFQSAEKGTQYENTDAMIANFVNSDLIVELNDRDSACTSISDGFTFSREYGNPKPLHSGVTDL